MTNKLLKLTSILFALIMLGAIFLPVAVAQADRQIQSDVRVIESVLEQRLSSGIENMYGVSLTVYSESDLIELESLVVLLLQDQCIQITNLDIKGLKRYAGNGNLILTGPIRFEMENVMHEIVFFTHFDLKNSSVEMISRDGIRYNHLKMNKVSESEEAIEFNIEQTTIMNGIIVESFSYVFSHPVENTFGFSDAQSADIYAESMSIHAAGGQTIFPPSVLPPFSISSVVLVPRVQFSLLVDSVAIGAAIGSLVPGAKIFNVLSAAITIGDVLLRRGLNVDTNRTFARIWHIFPAHLPTFTPPWPAIGHGV